MVMDDSPTLGFWRSPSFRQREDFDASATYGAADGGVDGVRQYFDQMQANDFSFLMLTLYASRTCSLLYYVILAFCRFSKVLISSFFIYTVHLVLFVLSMCSVYFSVHE